MGSVCIKLKYTHFSGKITPLLKLFCLLYKLKKANFEEKCSDAPSILKNKILSLHKY